MLVTLVKSDNEVCCEPQLPAIFDGLAGNSPFGMTLFFFFFLSFKATDSVTHRLHTKLISGMDMCVLLQIQMVLWSGFGKDQHDATVR